MECLDYQFVRMFDTIRKAIIAITTIDKRVNNLLIIKDLGIVNQAIICKNN